jgi:hypothetical protein
MEMPGLCTEQSQDLNRRRRGCEQELSIHVTHMDTSGLLSRVFTYVYASGVLSISLDLSRDYSTMSTTGIVVSSQRSTSAEWKKTTVKKTFWLFRLQQPCPRCHSKSEKR